MGLNLLKRFLLLSLIVFASSEESKKSQGSEDQIVLRKPSGSNGCSFYCTIQLMKTEQLDITPYEKLGCTHIVYGFATIGPEYKLESPTSFDEIEMTGQPGNYEKVQWLKKDNPDRKTLLGISTKKLDFISSDYTRSTVAKEAVETARWHGFDGIFLHVDDSRMFNLEMENFLITLKDQTEKTKKTWNETKQIEIVYGFPTNRISLGKSRLAELQQYVDAVYLYTDEVPSVSDPNIAVSLDPLFSSETVPREDAIEYNTDILIKNGLNREKLIIGLSTWARSYRLPKGTRNTAHNGIAAGPGKPGNRTRRGNGRLAYDEICNMVKDSELIYDSESSTVSFVQENVWYSFNPPKHVSFERKLKWISSHDFGGIGLSSFYGDDKDGNCHKGVFPIHKYVGDEFKCRLKREKRGNKACTRMCGFNVHDSFQLNFTGFQPNWCSHVILSSASLELTGALGVSSALKSALHAFSKWKTSDKPLLIISIGEDDATDRWRFAIGQPTLRSILIQNIVQFVDENGIDGIDVSWTLGKLENNLDTKMLSSFLQELKHKLQKKILIVSVTPHTTFNQKYDVAVLNNTADFILVQGHRFHSHSNLFTGHHSPLFVNSDLLQDPKMTVEGFALDWVSRGANREKLIIGFTAEGMAMVFSNFRTEQGTTIGALANVVKTRTYSDGKISQSDICALKHKNQTIVRYIEDLGVPYLVHGADFIAYDDEKSIKIKSIWASLSKFGGLAFFNVEKDNIDGSCPLGNPYPLLKTIANTQVCDSCPAFIEYQKNKTLNKCTPEFKTVCHYRLPAPSDPEKLDPALIPFPLCTQIVVEETFIGDSGEVKELIGFQSDSRDLLLKAARDVNYKKLVASLKCNMTSESFDRIMLTKEDRSILIDSIQQHINAYRYMGVELSCDHLLTPSNKDNFDSFLRELRSTFLTNNRKDCPNTISIRIPAWTTNLNDGYKTSTLNSLHHVMLDTFQVSNNQSQLVSPLFGGFGQDQPDIDSTIRSWIATGLSPSSIVMTVPAYGILQKFTDRMILNHGIGSQTQKDSLRIISQNQVCSKLIEAGISRKMDYQFVATYVTSAREEWLSFETQETITYKLKYALRQGLGGVGLMSLNEDDFLDACKQGKFPLLETITRGKCGVSLLQNI